MAEPSEETSKVVTSWYAYEDYEPTRPVGVRFPYNPAIRFHFRTRTELGLWNVIASVLGVFYLTQQTCLRKAASLIGLSEKACVYSLDHQSCKEIINRYKLLNAYLAWGEWPRGCSAVLPIPAALADQLSALQLGMIKLPPSIGMTTAAPPEKNDWTVFAWYTSADWIYCLEKSVYFVDGRSRRNPWFDYDGQEAVLIQESWFTTASVLEKYQDLLQSDRPMLTLGNGKSVPLLAKRIYICCPEASVGVVAVWRGTALWKQ